jgi:prolipoprotein diacylglyceryltransferase
MYLDFFYIAIMLVLSTIALIHIYKTRSIYGMLMLIYLTWPGIFKFLCKHFANNIRDVDTVVAMLTAEKLVSILLIVPLFFYVINKDMEKSRKRKNEATIAGEMPTSR